MIFLKLDGVPIDLYRGQLYSPQEPRPAGIGPAPDELGSVCRGRSSGVRGHTPRRKADLPGDPR